jgi:hypothetical protein
MFEKIYERVKSEARSAVRLSALAAACLGAAAIAFGFLCAAGFVFALNQLGPIYACLIGFGVFLFGTLILVLGYAALSVRRRRLERERAAADAGASLLANPQLVLLGLRMVESIGVRRLLPIVALGAAAFALGSGVMRARAGAGQDNPPAG